MTAHELEHDHEHKWADDGRCTQHGCAASLCPECGRAVTPEHAEDAAGACPGSCNNQWRRAEHKAAQDGKDHDLEPAQAAPIWCRDCQTEIIDALRRLPTLAADAAAMPAGRLASSGSTEGRAATRTGSPSGSPAWDLADDIMRWVMQWEDALRRHLTDPWTGRVRQLAVKRTGRLAVTADGSVEREPDDGRIIAVGPLLRDAGARRRLVDAVRYLADRGTALLSWIQADDTGSHEVGKDAGQELLSLAARAEKLTGRDKMVHRLPGECPRCGRRKLSRKDGADLVKCSCGACWDYDHYEFLARVATQPKSETGMITVAAAADLHKVPPATVHTWIRRYQVPNLKIRGVVYVSDEALADCEALRREEPRGRRRKRRRVARA